MLTRESVTAGVSGRVDKRTEKRLEMMWCQHGCHSCKEQEVYNAVRTTHCATETIDTRSHSLQTHREFYSDERDLREHFERRAQQAFIGENSVHRTLNSIEYNIEIQNVERRNSEYA